MGNQSNPTIVIFDGTQGVIDQSPYVSARSINSSDDNVTIRQVEVKTDGVTSVNAYVIDASGRTRIDPLAVYRQVAALQPTHICYIGHSAGLNEQVQIGDIVIAKNAFSYNSSKSIARGSYWEMDALNCSNAFLNSAHVLQKDSTNKSSNTKITIGDGCSFSNSVMSFNSVESVARNENLMFIADYSTAADICKTLSKSSSVDFVALTLVSDHVDMTKKADPVPHGDENLMNCFVSLLKGVQEREGIAQPTQGTGEGDDIEIRVAGRADPIGKDFGRRSPSLRLWLGGRASRRIQSNFSTYQSEAHL
jgi:hypothetical protein